MASTSAPIPAAVAGMHARFPEAHVHQRDHEATITCDMLQFWLLDAPVADRQYEFTLSFLKKDVQRWAKLASEKGVEHFNIEFPPSAVLREMAMALANGDYVAAHSPIGLEQLVEDLETMLGAAKEALALRGRSEPSKS